MFASMLLPRLVLMVCCLALSPVGMGGYNGENSMLYTVRPGPRIRSKLIDYIAAQVMPEEAIR